MQTTMPPTLAAATPPQGNTGTSGIPARANGKHRTAIKAPIAHAALLACLTLGAVVALPAQQAHAQQSASQHYQIGAGTLDQALNRFAAAAGITISFDGSLTEGRTSSGLNGNYSVQQGLDRLLADTDLQAVRDVDGGYSLRRIRQLQTTGNSGAQQLPEVEVKASLFGASTTEGSASYAANAVKVFRGSQSLRETPQPVTVITRQALDDQALPELHAVLQKTPGVTVDYTDSERVNYYSRGHQIDSIQFDGASVNQGGSVFIQPDTAVLDHIEILRGSAGLLKGSGNPSATVNLVRKKPTADFQASAGLTLGSWQRRRLEGDVSGSLNDAGTLRGRLVAVAEQKDFFQKVREEDRKVLYGVVEADLARSTLLTAGLEYTDLEASGSWGGLPAGLDGSQLGLPRNTYLGADWSRWNRSNQHAFVELQHLFESGWEIKLNASNTRFRNKGVGFLQTSWSRPRGATDPYLLDVSAAAYAGDASDQNSLNVTANGPFNLLGRRHELMVGADTRRVKTTGTHGYWGLNAMTGVDVRTWDPYTSMPEPVIDFSNQTTGTFYSSPDNYTRQHGAYAAARLSLADPVTAIVGARLSWWNYQVPSQPSSDYRVSREVSPYLGLIYDFAKDWSAYASYSEIFTPQNAYDANGKIIDPIRGEDYEAGIKGELFDGRLNASLSVFRIHNVGRAMEDSSTANPCLPYYATGYCRTAGGKTRSQGWELELAGEVLPNWHVMGGYTNTRTKYLRDSSASNTGQPLRTADPEHLLRLFTTYRLGGALQGLTLGSGVQAQSDTYVTSGGVTYRQNGYAVYSAMASYRFNRNMHLQLNINNLFDKIYYTKVGAGVNNYYGDPRNFALSFKASF